MPEFHWRDQQNRKQTQWVHLSNEKKNDTVRENSLIQAEQRFIQEENKLTGSKADERFSDVEGEQDLIEAYHRATEIARENALIEAEQRAIETTLQHARTEAEQRVSKKEEEKAIVTTIIQNLKLHSGFINIVNHFVSEISEGRSTPNSPTIVPFILGNCT